VTLTLDSECCVIVDVEALHIARSVD
jgi:hypothetical protein